MKKIYVGNMPFSATETEIRELFEQYGVVSSVKLITDRDTGRARGFGFVEMANDGEATAAMQALNGKDMGGRALRVSEAQERADNRSGGRGGDRRGGDRRGSGGSDRRGGDRRGGFRRDDDRDSGGGW